MFARLVVCLWLAATFVADAAHARGSAPRSPSQLYGELFHRVQTERLFADSKTFADSTAKKNATTILHRYASEKSHAGFSLKKFVVANFNIPAAVSGDFHTAPGEELRAHVDRLWGVLTRKPVEPQQNSSAADSRLPLASRYVVPGGRFREMYYWDSYFTMLGLQSSGREDLVADMVENFAGLIDRYGHIPNGTRTYYLSRSQPPFFAAMVELQAGSEGDDALIRRLPQLELEYAFWMEGAQSLARGAAHRRVVRLADGSVLNRYWDDLATPRDEAYAEDLATARKSGRNAGEVYRDLRAAAESGWDFSSRWLGDGKTLATIHTTDFVPVDLNSLLYQLETLIARGCEAARRADCQRDMQEHARSRQAAMSRFLWDGRMNAFVDYDWRHARASTQLTAATAYPLFVGLATPQQAQRIASTIRASLLMSHGLATTLQDSGEQWDAPNGWAPLQWVAIAGLRRYDEQLLAEEIARRWVEENARVYCRTGKLVEKYNVRDAGAGAGGEYPVQDGFGWTNGVLVRLLTIYPELAKQDYRFNGAECPPSLAYRAGH